MTRLASAQAREARLELRIPRNQKALFEHAAELQGRTLSDFAVASVNDAAMRVIEELLTLRLSMRDGRALAKAVLSPPRPNTRLKAVAQRYLKLTGARMARRRGPSD